MSEKGEKEIIVRLNTIINLLLEISADKESNATAKERIRILSKMGLSSGDIGRIIGKEARYVTANISQIKREK
jgi:predicted RNA-binding protein YlqC (UPF0109 family)